VVLPEVMYEWRPEVRLADWVSEVVDELDLSGVVGCCEGWCGGKPAYHRGMLVRFLFYACAGGVPRSRKVVGKR
jgi:hypothetical protein